MESQYVCAACGGVVACARKEAHEAAWCPAAQREEGSEDEVEPPTVLSVTNEAGLGGARALMSPLYEEVVSVEFHALQGLTIALEQDNIFGPSDTGGALWYVDRVVAAYLASGLDGAAASPGSDVLGNGGGAAAKGTRDVALVLGCGGAPLSGLVACAVGWDVVLTDLGMVLDQCRRNVRRNMPAIQACTGAVGVAPGSIRVQELPFGDEDALATALAIAEEDDDGAGRELGRLMVLCSDCVWQRFLHAPLLKTIASSLRRGASGGAGAIVAFQARHKENEVSFLALARSKELGLEVVEIDLSSVLPEVPWPLQVQDSMLQRGVDLLHHFFVYRVTLR